MCVLGIGSGKGKEGQSFMGNVDNDFIVGRVLMQMKILLLIL